MNMVLSLFPNTRGVGYSFVEVPNRLIEYGVLTTHPPKNDRLVTRVTKLINAFQPSVVLVRAVSKRSTDERVNTLIKDIVAVAKDKDIPVEQYTREEMRGAFDNWDISTKEEIVQKVIQWFPQLADYTPKRRRPWMPEAHYMGIFDSIALLAVYVERM